MIRALSALVLFASVQAFACPQLAGSYSCKDDKGNAQTTQITQADKGNVTTYNIDGQDLITDNQARPLPDQDSVKQITLRAFCNDTTTLHVVMNGKYYDNGAAAGDVVMNMDVSMSGTNLQQVSNGTLTLTNGQSYPMNGTTTCTRNP